jgi:hypothetical protein
MRHASCLTMNNSSEILDSFGTLSHTLVKEIWTDIYFYMFSQGQGGVILFFCSSFPYSLHFGNLDQISTYFGRVCIE